MKHAGLWLPLLMGCTTAIAADDGVAPFASRVVSFKPGAGATYGQDKLPGVVLGPPQGAGTAGGSTDVLSLGTKGEIVLAFDGLQLVDGPGPDLLVFENAFTGWQETASVAVSIDGLTWHEWPCHWQDKAGGYPGCAGVHAVLSNPDNGIDPTDPDRAGGDAFDLADVTVTTARFVRIRDTGHNPADPPGAGFDLDAIALIHTAPE
jgi:hypothetical protein